MSNYLIGAAALALLGLAGGLQAAEQGPGEVIQAASDEILQVLAERREELKNNPRELYDVVDKILLPRFDRRYSGGLVMGKYWRRATPEQREEFILALYHSLLKTYSENILQYKEDQLKVLPVEGDISDGKAVVETRVTLESGVETPVAYRMRKTDDGWKAYDVVIEGISYVTNYRQQYAGEFKTKGIDKVIAELKARAEQPGEPEAGGEGA